MGNALILANPRARTLTLTCIAIALAALIPNRGLGDLLITALVFAALGAAWNWLGGFAGELSFGHGIFCGIGAYGVAISGLRGGSPWFAAVGGGIIAIVVALIFGFMVFSLPRAAFWIVTLAVGVAAAPLVLHAFGPLAFTLPDREGFLYLNFADDRPYVFLALGMFIVVQLLTVGLERIRAGYFLRALRGNPRAAATLGIGRRKWVLLPFAVSAFVAAIGGALLALHARSVSIDDCGIFISLGIAFAGIAGGRGSLVGPLVGGAIVALIGNTGVPRPIVAVVLAAGIVAALTAARPRRPAASAAAGAA
jgi:branched-chain amino acid transport system permease protein